MNYRLNDERLAEIRRRAAAATPSNHDARIALMDLLDEVDRLREVIKVVDDQRADALDEVEHHRAKDAELNRLAILAGQGRLDYLELRDAVLVKCGPS